MAYLRDGPAPHATELGARTLGALLSPLALLAGQLVDAAPLWTRVRTGLFGFLDLLRLLCAPGSPKLPGQSQKLAPAPGACS